MENEHASIEVAEWNAMQQQVQHLTMQLEHAGQQMQAAHQAAMQAHHEAASANERLTSYQQQTAHQQATSLQPAVSSAAAAAADPRVKLPKPDKCNGRAVINWSYYMEVYLRGLGVELQSAQSVLYAAAYLQGPALTWYRFHEVEVAAGREAAYTTWAAFKQAFTTRFTTQDPAESARKKLDQLRQTGMASTYAADFNAVMVELPHMDESDRVHWFVNGLKPGNVQTYTRLMDPKTLATAIELAIRADTSSQPTRFWSSGNTHGTHGAHGGSTPMELGTADVGTKPGNDRVGKSKVTCFYCGIKGHYARDCFKKQRDRARGKLKPGAGAPGR